MAFQAAGLLLGSTAVTCFAVYIWLACTERRLELSADKFSKLSRLQQVFLLFAAAGFLVCIYQGTRFMFSWMPDSWGSVDEDGEYLPLKGSLATAFTLFGGFPLMFWIDEMRKRNLEYRSLAVTARGLQEILESPEWKLLSLVEQFEKESVRIQQYHWLSTLARQQIGRFVESAKDCRASLEESTRRLQTLQGRLDESDQRWKGERAAAWKKAEIENEELEFLRKNSGARIVVRQTKEDGRSWQGFREIVSADGRVLRSTPVGFTIYDG